MRISDWSSDVCSSDLEMLAKVQAGATGYDIVFPSVHMHDIMATLDLLEKTNINAYEGFKNIDPAFLRAKSDPKGEDRKSVVSGKSVSVRVDLGGRRIIIKKTPKNNIILHTTHK